jgi:uncharacterized Zn-finger protein
MLDTIEVFYVDGDSAVCDGGSGALGHPRVYLAIDRSGRAICPYCGRHFVRDPGRAGHSEVLDAAASASLTPSAPATQY